MLNSFMLVGRIQEIKKSDDNTIIVLKVSRSYKNQEGLYIDDFIPVTLGKFFSEQLEYLKVNSLVGVKGSINCIDDNIILKCEKMTFLASNNKE